MVKRKKKMGFLIHTPSPHSPTYSKRFPPLHASLSLSLSLSLCEDIWTMTYRILILSRIKMANKRRG